MNVQRFGSFLSGFDKSRATFYLYYNKGKMPEARKVISIDLFTALDLAYAFEDYMSSGRKLVTFLNKAVFDGLEDRYTNNPNGFVASLGKIGYFELQYYLPLISDEDFRLLVDKSQSFLKDLDSYLEH